jgi:hypothetical protein
MVQFAASKKKMDNNAVIRAMSVNPRRRRRRRTKQNFDPRYTYVPTRMKNSFCQKWDLNPRPHTQKSPPYQGVRNILESGALDRSAILTCLKTFVTQIIK